MKKQLSEMIENDYNLLVNKVTRVIAKSQGWVIEGSLDVLEAQNPRLQGFTNTAILIIQEIQELQDSEGAK